MSASTRTATTAPDLSHLFFDRTPQTTRFSATNEWRYIPHNLLYLCSVAVATLSELLASLRALVLWSFGLDTYSSDPYADLNSETSRHKQALGIIVLVVLAVLVHFLYILSFVPIGGVLTTIFSSYLLLGPIITNGSLTLYSILTWQPTFYLAAISLSFIPFTRNLIIDSVSTLRLQPWLFAFWGLVAFKFVKVIVHTISYILYRPIPISNYPTIYPSDVTVIVPTIGFANPDDNFKREFSECIETILLNNPHQIIISTVSDTQRAKAIEFCNNLLDNLKAELKVPLNNDTNISVISIDAPNKRAQFTAAVRFVTTPIICYADDHVFWPSTFLESCLANFEDPSVGLVGTVKRVRRTIAETWFQDFLNYIAVMYLERHNFECTASSYIDGGVFVISGRTALARTSILQSAGFQNGFLNETWLFGRVGPMKVDDDNFITRYMINHGFKTIFHNSTDALMETTLGISGLEKFKGQLFRWVRTTWRSNTTSLFVDRTCWRLWPWTTYAMFISSFVNFALFYDIALILTLWKAGYDFYSQEFLSLFIACLISKLIKPFPHLMRYPRDIPYALTVGIAFGWLHSFIKLWAGLTATNIDWSGRKGIDAVGNDGATRRLSATLQPGDELRPVLQIPESGIEEYAIFDDEDDESHHRL